MELIYETGVVVVTRGTRVMRSRRLCHIQIGETDEIESQHANLSEREEDLARNV